MFVNRPIGIFKQNKRFVTTKQCQKDQTYNFLVSRYGPIAGHVEHTAVTRKLQSFCLQHPDEDEGFGSYVNEQI
jgi:hypothetical protein